MTLDKQSLTAKFYKWSYPHNELPADFCTYFWNTLWSIIFLPAHWWLTALKDSSSLLGRISAGVAVQGVAGVIGLLGALILHEWFGAPDSLWMILPGLLWIAVLVSGVIGISALIKLLWPSRKRTGPTTAEQISAVYGTVRNKYCTKIDWQ